MRLTFGLDKLGPAPAGRAVTVGTFDGVHLGHQQIVGQVTTVARAKGLLATVVSFEPHPLAVLRPDAAPLQLSTADEKAELMSALGVDELVVLPFTAALAVMEPEQFAQDVLAGALRAKYVCEGWNFRFGKGGAGSPELLTKIGPALGFAADVVEPVEVDGVIVSSTLVREWLVRGDIEGVWRVLGRPYYVSGTVTEGDGRGRLLGFPTANVAVPARRALPASGVYAVGVRIGADGPWLPGMANLGQRPTFGGEGLRLEVHLLDGGRDVYGEELTVAFIKKLRAEQKFSGPDALVAQLGVDRQQTEAVWADRGHLLGHVYSPLPM